MNRTEFLTTSEELRQIRRLAANLTVAIYERNTRTADIRKQQAKWNAEQLADISASTNGDPDKPKATYPNEQARAAALLIRQDESREYLDWTAQLDELQSQDARDHHEIDNLRADAEHARNLLDYELSHASDEITNKLGELTRIAEKQVDNAAFNAVRNLLVGLIANGPKTPEEEEAVNKALLETRGQTPPA